MLRLPAVAEQDLPDHHRRPLGGGLVCRDQMVGPWQVPVADVAVTVSDYRGYTGEAMAMGERTPMALLHGPASGRMAVGEAVTNIAAECHRRLGNIALSANWMAPAGHPGEDAVLYDTVRAVGMELCPALGIAIPVGKDSMSMKTVWKERGLRTGGGRAAFADRVGVRARVSDVRRTLTPQLRTDAGATRSVADRSGRGRNRLGGSALAQVYRQIVRMSAGPG